MDEDKDAMKRTLMLGAVLASFGSACGVPSYGCDRSSYQKPPKAKKVVKRHNKNKKAKKSRRKNRKK